MERKCAGGCGKTLGPMEGHDVPITIPATVHYPIPSGGINKYCDECYKNLHPELDFSEIESNYQETITKIKDLKIGSNATIKAKVGEQIRREIVKEDLEIGVFKLTDDTGEIDLILWNDNIDKVKEGITYRFEGYIKEFQGKKQITVQKGKIVL
ncbi:MAG: OB-fold nucleic acid binding domain-containing protein [Nanoarchaeota archaeon]